MQVKLLGIQKLDFTTSNGENIKGTYLYCAFKDPNIEGLKTEKIYIRDGITIPECKLNDNLDIDFNMKGKAVGVVKI